VVLQLGEEQQNRYGPSTPYKAILKSLKMDAVRNALNSLRELLVVAKAAGKSSTRYFLARRKFANGFYAFQSSENVNST